MQESPKRDPSPRLIDAVLGDLAVRSEMSSVDVGKLAMMRALWTVHVGLSGGLLAVRALGDYQELTWPQEDVASRRAQRMPHQPPPRTT